MRKENSMKKGIIICLAAAMLTACAETPESILNKEIVEPDDTVKEIIEPELIPTDDLAEDISTALSRSYSNFTLGSGVNVELPDEYHECSFTQIADFEENYYEVLSRFFDEETLSSVDITWTEWADGVKGYYFEDTMQKIYGSVSDNGHIFFVRPSAYDNKIEGGDRIKIYHIDRNDDLSDSYDLNGTEVTVAQAAEFAQKWLDENYADLEPDYEISVKTMIARQTDMGIYSYDIFAEKKYKGTILDSLLMTLESTEDNNTKIKYSTQEIFMQMFTPDEIGCLTNSTGIIIPKEEETLDELISLTSAMRFIESTFTDFNETMEISDINLKYTLTPIYDYANFRSYTGAGISYDSRLVWEIAIDVTEEEMPKGYTEEERSNYLSNGAMQKYIYIDAQTGEMDFEFDVNLLMK